MVRSIFTQDKRPASRQNVLANIAQGAPLEHTLCILLEQVEAANAALRHAILVCNEDRLSLRLGAAPGLQADHRLGLDALAGAMADAVTACLPGETLEAGQFALAARALALSHGLHVVSITPLYSPAKSLLGLCVVHAATQKPPAEADQVRLADALQIAAIAIASSQSEGRIRRAETGLQENTNSLALAIEGSATGIWDRNVATGEIIYSKGWKSILGYAEDEVSNRIEESYTRVHPDDLAGVRQKIQDHFDGKTDSYAVEHRIRCKDGSYKWISSRGKVVSRDGDGRPLRMTGTTSDITAMKELANRLQQNVDLITSLTNEIPGLVFQYHLMPDGQAFFSYVSEGITDIYGLRPEQVAASAAVLDNVIHPEDCELYHASLRASAGALTRWHLEYRVLLPGLGVCWRQGVAKPCRLEDGSTLWHGFIADITERKRTEAELQTLATTDFLTGLPNRRSFMDRMGDERARIERIPDAMAAVLMFDLDHFKLINDRYGHATGDDVLKHFSGILRSALRKIDSVGRIGGEEFAVILPATTSAAAEIFAARVQKKLAEMPLLIGSHPLAVTVSIGIAVMDGGDTGVDDPLSRADQALYRAKAGGRDRIEINEKVPLTLPVP